MGDVDGDSEGSCQGQGLGLCWVFGNVYREDRVTFSVRFQF